MIQPERFYVPALKWKMGEYQALYRLDRSTKANIIPLLHVPPIGYDFEEGRLMKSLDEYIGPFVNKYITKWGKRKSFIDFHSSLISGTLPNGQYAIDHIFDGLRAEKTKAVPVVGFSKPHYYKQSVQNIHNADGLGACFRIKLDEALSPTLSSDLKGLLAATGTIDRDIDIVLDLKVPTNFEPYSTFAKLVLMALSAIKSVYNFRSYTVLASSFPNELMKLITAPGSDIDRHEWPFFKELLKLTPKEFGPLNFGDYVTENPDFTAPQDMRLVKPYGKLIYTHGDKWFVRRGPNVRDNGFSQYQTHCNAISTASFFSGQNYSKGDEYIYDCAHNNGSTGQLTVWKWVAANHHMTLITNDLATLLD